MGGPSDEGLARDDYQLFLFFCFGWLYDNKWQQRLDILGKFCTYYVHAYTWT